MTDTRPSILVVGSINMDLVLQTPRVPLAGESFFGETYSYVPGGKGANQAVAAAKLGAKLTFVGRVGADAHGARLKEQLAEHGIATEFLIEDPTRPSGLAVIMLEASGENRILVYSGANMNLCAEDFAAAFHRPHDAVLLTLEIPSQVIIEVCRIAREKGIPVILDAGPAQPFDLRQTPGLEILSPNETEATALTGLECRTVDDARKAARALAETSAARMVVIKLGDRGALLHREGQTELIPAFSVEPVDTTAAGDSFTAALAVHYLQHGNPAEAVRFGNAAGGLAVTQLGAQPSLPDRDQVERFLSQHSG